MSNPYTSVTVSNYNSNPPTDDGAQTPANEITWSKHKTKLGDPLKTALESINTNASTAFGKVSGGVTSVSADYTVLAGDQGKLIVQTGDSKTITMIAPATASSPFQVSIVNRSAGSTNLTVTRSSAETINGASSITVLPNYGVTLECDGTNWTAHNHIPIGFGGLTDPGADRLAFWDDSAGKVEWLELGTGLSVSGTTLSPTVAAIATQAEMETPASATLAVAPARQHFHPGHPKTWGKANSAGTINADYGIASVTDHGAGDITWTWDTAFSGTHYAAVIGIVDGGGVARSFYVSTQVAASCRVQVNNSAPAGVDPDQHYIVALGDFT
jgi:hypothetical protein